MDEAEARRAAERRPRARVPLDRAVRAAHRLGEGRGVPVDARRARRSRAPGARPRGRRSPGRSTSSVASRRHGSRRPACRRRSGPRCRTTSSWRRTARALPRARRPGHEARAPRCRRGLGAAAGADPEHARPPRRWADGRLCAGGADHAVLRSRSDERRFDVVATASERTDASACTRPDDHRPPRSGPSPVRIDCYDGTYVGDEDAATRLLVRSPEAMHIITGPASSASRAPTSPGALDVDGDIFDALALRDRVPDVRLSPVAVARVRAPRRVRRGCRARPYPRGRRACTGAGTARRATRPRSRTTTTSRTTSTA